MCTGELYPVRMLQGPGHSRYEWVSLSDKGSGDCVLSDFALCMLQTSASRRDERRNVSALYAQLWSVSVYNRIFPVYRFGIILPQGTSVGIDYVIPRRKYLRRDNKG